MPDAEHANLTKSGAILFGSGATDPSPTQFDGVKLLAGNLNAALEAGATRVQLEAYSAERRATNPRMRGASRSSARSPSASS